MNWQVSLILWMAVNAVVAVALCVKNARRKRGELLPPPQRAVFRDAYSPSRYSVGHMSGVGK